MRIIQNGYSCEQKIRLFAKLFFDEEETVFIYSNFCCENGTINVYTTVVFEDQTVFSDDYFPASTVGRIGEKNLYDAAVTRSFCHCAKKIRQINLPWGVMCGIRPAKMVRELFDQGFSSEEALIILKDIYEVDQQKLELAIEVAENEQVLLNQMGENSVSLYIGIPFCPTRCLYCSFVSTDVRVSGKYMDEYVRLLLEEIKKTGTVMEKMGWYAETIYIGGGTPTTLCEKHLKMIFECLKAYVVTDRLKEFTLEAGRPDTITEEKLLAAKAGGVNRISINPQTMNNEILKRVGRAHTPGMVEEAFSLARRLGFDNINMDLIAGLPGETVEMFRYSLDKVIGLDPENITVHCMCIKRAASLRFSQISLTEGEDMNRMLSYTQKRMKETGRAPYYMYRQKNSSGNLENVGYARAGCMSFYNVNIMEEVQTILALGGGGSTKLVMGDRIERIFNFKDPLEYIRRFNEILEKKDQILTYFKK